MYVYLRHHDDLVKTEDDVLGRAIMYHQVLLLHNRTSLIIYLYTTLSSEVDLLRLFCSPGSSNTPSTPAENLSIGLERLERPDLPHFCFEDRTVHGPSGPSRDHTPRDLILETVQERKTVQMLQDIICFTKQFF